MVDKNELLGRIARNDITVGVVGLGYVGLPLVEAFGRRGIAVLGLDIDQRKVDMLKQGRSYIEHIPTAMVEDLFLKRRVAEATTDFARAGDCDALLICVPTPLDEHRGPDMSYVVNTTESLGPHIRAGQLISLESTTYPGTTDEVMVPVLERLSGLTAGKDFFVAYSPEREDPNNRQFTTSTIPKVVGGIDADSLEVALAIYGKIIAQTVPVSSCRVAEATKLMENIFRCVNIALVNELKVVFASMGIDVHEVINAAKTKPFGFMPFYPGPGLGGHCIPIDPFYLSWKAREYGQSTRFIELAGEINIGMPAYVIQCLISAMNDHGMCLRNRRILLVGLAYKGNVDDDRESPTYVIWEQLAERGAKVDYYDPHIPVVRPSREHSQLAGNCSVTLEAVRANTYDAMIICTAHDVVDHDELTSYATVVVDTRHVMTEAANVYSA